MALPFFRASRRNGIWRSAVAAVLGVAALSGWQVASQAQEVDCARLQAMISHQGGGNRYANAARKQAGELARTQAYAHQLGCDRSGFLFFGGSDNPQCPGINGRIQQMQANLGQLQAAGGGGGGDLVARYNAYCRGGQPPRERGFFESLFGGSGQEPPQGPPPDAVPDDGDAADGNGAHRGSQAVCVRTCDGGFFPLPISARHDADDLNHLCSALCPGTEAEVFTRSPNSEIKTAMALDGKAYMDLPNALKYQKEYSSSCTCRPAGKSWAEALASAEEVLGNQRKGDILVTQQKSDEMSRPTLDPKAKAALLAAPGTAKVSPEEAGKLAAAPPVLRDTIEVTGSDGVKRPVRRVGPQP